MSLVVHVFICILLQVVVARTNKGAEIPVYLAWVLPGLGALMVVVLCFSLNYFRRKGMILEEYFHYINYERFQDGQLQVDYEKEIRTLSYLDQMQLAETQHKKHLIAQTQVGPLEEQVNILQVGLLDADAEVQHYSAVGINLLENQYTYTLNSLREEYNHDRRPGLLKQIAKVYRNYIASGLLSGNMLAVINQEYIEVLQLLTRQPKAGWEEWHQLVLAQVRAGDLIAAAKINLELGHKYPDRGEYLLNSVRIAYENKDYLEVSRLLQQAHNLHTPEISGQIAFWLGKGEQV